MFGKKVALLLLSLLILGGVALAHTPKDGLGGIAVSPDGKTVVVGGDSRVLYIVDANSLTVKKRVWIKTQIYELAFNKDGSVLVVEDTSETVHFIKTSDWSTINEVSKAGNISAAPAVNTVVGYQSSSRKSTIKVLSMMDGRTIKNVEYPGKVIALGIDAQAKKMVFLAEGPKDKEKKVPYSDIPKDLKGLDKKEFEQKNDGKTSMLVYYDLAAGKQLSEKNIFFYPGSSPVVLVNDKNVLVLNYGNVNASFNGDKITLFQGKNSYNYGIGISPDRKHFMSGGLRNATYCTVDGMLMKSWKIDSLPSWPEYFKGFGFAPDGSAYGGTTAYRLVKVDKNGALVKTIPIY